MTDARQQDVTVGVLTHAAIIEQRRDHALPEQQKRRGGERVGRQHGFVDHDERHRTGHVE